MVSRRWWRSGGDEPLGRVCVIPRETWLRRFTVDTTRRIAGTFRDDGAITVRGTSYRRPVPRSFAGSPGGGCSF